MRQAFSKLPMEFRATDTLHVDKWPKPRVAKRGLVINVSPPDLEQQIDALVALSSIPSDHCLLEFLDGSLQRVRDRKSAKIDRLTAGSRKIDITGSWLHKELLAHQQLGNPSSSALHALQESQFRSRKVYQRREAQDAPLRH